MASAPSPDLNEVVFVAVNQRSIRHDAFGVGDFGEVVLAHLHPADKIGVKAGLVVGFVDSEILVNDWAGVGKRLVGGDHVVHATVEHQTLGDRVVANTLADAEVRSRVVVA